MDKHTDDNALKRLLGPPGPELLCDECFDRIDEYVELELRGADADAVIRGCAPTSRAVPPVTRTTTACASSYGGVRGKFGAAAGAQCVLLSIALEDPHEQRHRDRPAAGPGSNVEGPAPDPGAQAFMLLRIAFTVAPILFGLDKFAEVMISDWPKYLAPEFNDLIPGSAQDAMYIVGGIEIAAGLVVAIVPRFGGLLVAAWLGGIIVSLLLVGGYADIALRDFGLLLGALSLSRLASAY